MLNTLNFYNAAHNGDVHFSREFIKHFINHIKAKEYISWHVYSPKLLKDIPNLQHKHLKDMPVSNREITCLHTDGLQDKIVAESLRKFQGLNLRKRTERQRAKRRRIKKRIFRDTHNEITREIFKPYELIGDDLFINTWVLAGWAQDYLMAHKQFPLDKFGFIETNMRKFTGFIETLRNLNINCEVLLDDKLSYIPKIDYSAYEIHGVDKFVRHNPGPKVLICNGPVHGQQVFNFDFDIFIKLINKNNFHVITTAKTNIPGIYCTDDIIQAKDGDLNEISYLSTFCDIIIGRASGPFCFCEVRDNYFNPKKRMISITDKFTWGFWWYNPQNMVWTKKFKIDHLLYIFNKCVRDLGLKL